MPEVFCLVRCVALHGLGQSVAGSSFENNQG